MLSLRSLRLTMPLFTVPMAAALRVRAPMHTFALGPLAAERLTVPAVGSIRNLRATVAMCADRTVVESCTVRIQEALSPQVRHAPRAVGQTHPSGAAGGNYGCARAVAQKLEVKGAFDDPNGSHIVIECVSEAFEGKRSLARQQMVFKAIWDEMQGQGGNVHAVDTMILKAPSEVGK